ncbi:MAG TPA: c-type cytochrome [Terriglobales bacterium]|jgi:mono/diheme cytochrome c family protein|nr:c-type cytochrome [Terriglobales bacterium]
MFRRVDFIGILAALLAISGLACFLTTNTLLPTWLAYLGGPVLWFIGTVIAIIWMVCRFFPTPATRSNEAPTSRPGSGDVAKTVRSSLLILSSFLPMLILVPAQAADAAPGNDVFKSKCAMCHGQDCAGKTVMGQKFNIPDLHSADVQKKSASELAAIVTKGKNKMPAYEGKLTPEQISQVSAFIKSLRAQH